MPIQEMCEDMILRRLEERTGERNARTGCGLPHSSSVISIGRIFESIRMDVKDISARWFKASKSPKKEDQIYGQKLAEMARKHSSEAFYTSG
jgi:hypothetical protein